MAREFDGAGDRISLGVQATIDNATTISVSCWVWNDVINTDQIIFSNNDDTANAPGFFLFFDDTGGGSGRTDIYSCFIRDSAIATARVEGATNSAVQNTWQHVFFSFQANNGTGMQLWIDGSEDANSPQSTVGVIDGGQAGTASTLGETSTGTRDRDGRLAEFAVWDVILPDADIIALSQKASPLQIKPGDLIAYLPLYGIHSPEVDLSGNNRNGTLTNTTEAEHINTFMMQPPVFVTHPAPAAGGLSIPVAMHSYRTRRVSNLAA